MSCPAFERLAAAASGEDEAILAHLDDCSECQSIVEDQGAMRLLVAQAPAPRLSAAHQEVLGAEIMAHADWMPMRSRRVVPFAGAGLAVAAAIAIAFGLGAFRSTDDVVDVATIEPTRTPSTEMIVSPVVRIDGPDVDLVVHTPRPTTIVAERRATLDGTGSYSRKLAGDHELVKLSSGELTVDTDSASRRPVRVVTGDTTLAFKRARVKVIATRGAIAQVSVFAGTAELTINGTTQIIEAGMVWERPATPQDSSSVFQEGWTALREGRNADAISLFDRAVDPIVAEDALYWGAIASERIGDAAGAMQRYELLVEKFPTSPRAKKAKAALARLAPSE